MNEQVRWAKSHPKTILVLQLWCLTPALLSAPPVQDNQIATLSKKLSLMQGNDNSQNKVIIDQKIADLTNVLEQKKKASSKITKTLKEFEVSSGGPVSTSDTPDHQND